MTKIKSFVSQLIDCSLGNSRLFLPVLILIEVSIILLISNVTFETSDERVMNLIASGGYTGMPSERLIFMNLVIGYILQFLYTYFPFLNWYTWLLLSVVTISFFALQFISNLALKDRKLKIVTHIIILCIVFPLLVKICFTKIAAFSIISGLVLIFFNSNSRIYLVLGYLLVLIGVAIRMEVFLMLLLLIFPIYLTYIYQKKVTQLIHPSIVFILGILLSAFNYFNYRSSAEWKYFSILIIYEVE